jgi:hypothetical protein
MFVTEKIGWVALEEFPAVHPNRGLELPSLDQRSFHKMTTSKNKEAAEATVTIAIFLAFISTVNCHTGIYLQAGRESACPN